MRCDRLVNECLIPTPLQEKIELGKSLGVRLYIKREDLIDDIDSGHKFRKLLYVATNILDEKSNVLVTAGSLPSGQCAAVSSIARFLKIRSHIIYTGDEQLRPLSLEGNYLITSILASSITWIESSPWNKVTEKLRIIADKEKEQGALPYIIEPGIKRWPGILGSFDLGLELASQLSKKVNELNDLHIIAPAGTGITCLGLSAASKVLDLSWKVHGMLIGGSVESTESIIDKCRQELAQKLSRSEVLQAKVLLHPETIGDGYANPTISELKAIQDTLQLYRMRLDPNYMIKTYLGLVQLIHSGEINKSDSVVLINTGGGFGLFNRVPQLQQWCIKELNPKLSNL